MKHLFHTSVLAIIVIALAAFNLNEKRYACDDELNTAIIENLDWLKLTTREQLVKYPLNEQRSIYRAFDEVKRNALWTAKLEADARSYQGDQRQYLLLVSETLEVNPETAKALFPDKKELKRIFNTLYLDGEYQKPTKSLTADLSNMVIDDCECSAYYGDFCSGQCNENYNCEDSLFGCGWLWGQMCDGTCSTW